jgi:hypothetical protein
MTNYDRNRLFDNVREARLYVESLMEPLALDDPRRAGMRRAWAHLVAAAVEVALVDVPPST